MHTKAIGIQKTFLLTQTEPLLVVTDSGASSVSWRLSPSSSGYKSQSQMSESVTPSPTSTPHPVGECVSEEERLTDTCVVDARVVWAVTDIQNVPKGSIIINPQVSYNLYFVSQSDF